MLRLTASFADWLLDRMASRLNHGRLLIYSGSPMTDPASRPPQTALVEIPLPAPAFAPANGGLAVAFEVPPTVVDVTGEATWAQLLSGTGEPVGDVRVRTPDMPGASAGDVVVDRTDFHRGGLCVLSRITLQLPLRP